MAMIDKTPIKVAGDYNTATASTIARAAATREALGDTDFSKDYAWKKFTEFTNGIPFLEPIENNTFLEQSHTLEDGVNAGKIVLDSEVDGEYANPDFGQASEGFVTQTTPIKYIGGISYSINEQLRNKSITDELFTNLYEDKLTKNIRDYNNFVKKMFLDEVLNKIDDAAGDYLSPDGQALISANHVNKHGMFPWSNLITATGADITEKVDDFIKSVGEYSATTVDASGNFLETDFDVFIVPAYGPLMEAVLERFNISPTLDKIGSNEISQYFEKSKIYPQTTKSIRIFENSEVSIVSVKGMDADLILAMDASGDNLDTSEARPIKFKTTEAFNTRPPIENSNGSVNITSFAWFNFWTKGRGRNIVGGRIAAI